MVLPSFLSGGIARSTQYNGEQGEKDRADGKFFEKKAKGPGAANSRAGGAKRRNQKKALGLGVHDDLKPLGGPIRHGPMAGEDVDGVEVGLPLHHGVASA